MHTNYTHTKSIFVFLSSKPRYLAALLSYGAGTIFCVHGGIPRELCQEGSSLDIVRNLDCPLRSVHTNEMVYDMLWSDPSSPEQEHSPDLDQNGFGMSARGCTCFGEKSIDLFLDIHNYKHVFRGHEAQQSGVGVSKGARLTTIFSTSVSCAIKRTFLLPSMWSSLPLFFALVI
jgi:diadenosine tetraphosphatase ApaH/serine/threonine PP2A family protein phosphatase